MRHAVRVGAAAVLPALMHLLGSYPAPASAQSALERPPNLSGGWTAPPGPLHFHIIHRFNRVGEVNKVIASPTFLLASGVPFDGLVGVRYATSSDVAPTPTPNEWEIFARWRPVGGPDSPLRASVQAGHNFAVSSLDAEATLAAGAGPVTVVGTARAFSRPYGERSARYAAGGGGVLRLSRYAGVAGDVVWLLDREVRERVAWSAGVLLGIPFTPHTLSLHATNANTSTLQGSSRGRSQTRWGFEFTVPITPARLFGRPPAAAAPPEREPAAPTEPGRDTVRADIEEFRFAPGRIEVSAGTTVIWTNRGEQLHTATAVDGGWGSPLLDRGESWSHTFHEPGTHAFFCEPHPFMQGAVVVTVPDAEPGSDTDDAAGVRPRAPAPTARDRVAPAGESARPAHRADPSR